ncbi:MAG: hypothetical protein WKG01_10860 [Kofleriaceae bacterium]
MKERERIVVTGVLGVLVLAWLGFLVHRSPRFPGSGLGSAFGIAGAALMLVPLAYPLIKRTPVLNTRFTRHISMKSLLLVHVYAGILGPVLAIIHTGHKFDSLLGISLTAVMLLVVVNGFSVRYLLTYVGHEITDKLMLLQTARGDLDHAWGVLERSAPTPSSLPRSAGPQADVSRIAESVADLEYAIRTHELFKRWFRRSLTLHIVLSVAFYLLLALHIGSGIYFGLRWMR